MRVIEHDVFCRGKYGDVVHSVDQTPTEKLAPVSVATIHDVPAFDTSTLAGRLARRAFQRTVAGARKIACVSAATAADLSRLFPETQSKTEICLNGVDLERFSPGPKDTARLQHRFGLSMPYFLHVGVCRGRKNPDGILAAVRILTDQGAGAFKMVFAGPYQVDQVAATYLRAKAASLGLQDRIAVIGDVSDADLPFLYRSAIALVFPSIQEGFGYPPLEALACGVPAIVSRDRAMVEIVGSVAGVVDASNPEEIAAAMAHSLRNGSEKSIKTTGPRLAAQYATMDMANRYISFYRAALQ